MDNPVGGGWIVDYIVYNTGNSPAAGVSEGCIPPASNSNKPGIIVGAVIGASGLLLLIIATIFFIRRRRLAAIENASQQYQQYPISQIPNDFDGSRQGFAPPPAFQ